MEMVSLAINGSVYRWNSPGGGGRGPKAVKMWTEKQIPLPLGISLAATSVGRIRNFRMLKYLSIDGDVVQLARNVHKSTRFCPSMTVGV